MTDRNTRKISDSVIGVHYHVGARRDTHGIIYTDSSFARFVEELANICKEVRIFLHEGREDDSSLVYPLKRHNVVWINLGKKVKWEIRLVSWFKIKNVIKKDIDLCDGFIVRGDTPLGPGFLKYRIGNPTGLYLIQDYLDASKSLPFTIKGIRSKILALHHHFNQRKLLPRISKATISDYLTDIYSERGLFDVKTIPSSTFYRDETYCVSDRMKKEPINILFVGRIEIGKGIFTLLDAYKDLQKESQILFNLDIVGPMQLHNLKKRFLAEIERDKSIKYHGSLPIGHELWNFYRNADVFVLPSLHEAMGRVVLEAMVNCVPVIATNVGGIPQNVKHEETGLLVSTNRPDQIKNSVLRILNDQKLRKLIIKSAREHALNLTVENQTGKLLRHFCAEWGWL